jgi:acyl-CoA thioesterase-1
MIYPARFLTAAFLAVMALGWANGAQAQIVAIGASNVAGRGVSSSDAWPAQLERMLAAKGRRVHVTNAGINGDTNAGMLARLDSAVPQGTRLVLLDKYGGGWNGRRLGQGSQSAELAAIFAAAASGLYRCGGAGSCANTCCRTAFTSRRKDTGWWRPTCCHRCSVRFADLAPAR